MKLEAAERPWKLYPAQEEIEPHEIHGGDPLIPVCKMDDYDSERGLSNAELIVKAVNHHNALLAVVKRVVEREYDLDEESRNYHDDELEEWQELIRQTERN